METKRVCWENGINTLEVIYKDAARRSLSLPVFSLAPFAIATWNVIKWEFCVLLDFFVLLPMTLAIFLRNLFPGQWRYRSFSGKYWSYVIKWIWRGDASTFPLGVIRPLVTFMLKMHVHSRLRTVDRHLYLDDS